MSWGNWILAYLFDCVHPHITWPRRHRAGFTYVSCLDCGRELPYSLERMKIVTRKELVADRPQKCWGIDLFKVSKGGLSRSGQEIHRVIEYLQLKPIGEE
jgi:hypothetical protein